MTYLLTEISVLLGLRDTLDGGTILAVGHNTLCDILHPLVHHFLVSGEALHLRIGRSQGDRLDMLNLGRDLRFESLLGSVDVRLEFLLDSIVALVRLPNNRGRASGSSQETGTVNVRQLCHKKHFVGKNSSPRMQGDGKVLLKLMVDVA